ncbi:hypothetical protein SK128_020666 [Halocaridina rubra]|uniref:DNA/pantothenate metabolism flavoprotein C-terminal domain-containing protein n=1 Tax=Halocaridina rubra TaxID=373956 RepID=A0AAN8X6K8_HALRR
MPNNPMNPKGKNGTFLWFSLDSDVKSLAECFQQNRNICDLFHVCKDYSMVHPIWQSYQRVKAEGRLLWLTFTSLSDYLWLLRSATQCLQLHAPKALLYLAAAHKIQSASGPLTVTLQIVPKMLSPLVSIWGPELFVVSFKLETDEKKLIEKATGALQKYKHNLVIGNLLHTRREETQ